MGRGQGDSTIRPVVQASLERALRDVFDGHLAVIRREDGQDIPDRGLIGAPREWYLILEEQGLYEPPQASTGYWRLTEAGLDRTKEILRRYS